MKKRYTPNGGDHSMNVWKLVKGGIVFAAKGERVRTCETEGLLLLDLVLEKQACGEHSECSMLKKDQAMLGAKLLALYMNVQGYEGEFLMAEGNVSSTIPPAPVLAISHTLKPLQDVVTMSDEQAKLQGGEFAETVTDAMGLGRDEAGEELKLLTRDPHLPAANPLPKIKIKNKRVREDVPPRLSERSTKGKKKAAYVDAENLLEMEMARLKRLRRDWQ